MPKEKIPFEDFLANMNPDNTNFVNETHEFMLQSGCTYRISATKSGHILSYMPPKTKKVLFNYMLRKGGLLVRIYGSGINNYAAILSGLPENMIKSIEKAKPCKGLNDPAKAKGRCPLGYAFDLNGTEQRKCRYKSFVFAVKDENYTAIRRFIESELKERI